MGASTSYNTAFDESATPWDKSHVVMKSAANPNARTPFENLFLEIRGVIAGSRGVGGLRSPHVLLQMRAPSPFCGMMAFQTQEFKVLPSHPEDRIYGNYYTRKIELL